MGKDTEICEETREEMIQDLPHLHEYIESNINAHTPMQTMHQNSVHENSGFVAVVLAKYESNKEKYLTRCNGAFFDNNISVTATKKTNTRSVDGKQIDSSLGKIVSVEATAFPTNGEIETRLVTAWFRNGYITLVYFRNGF